MNTDLINMGREVYAHLQDEISRKIYEAKCLHAMTGEVSAMTGLGAAYRNLNSDMEWYASKLQKGMHCLIYGAGVAGHYLYGRFQYFGVKVDAFIDEDESKGEIDEATGVRIIREEQLRSHPTLYKDSNIFISYPNMQLTNEIRTRLVTKLGIDEKKLAMGLFDLRNNPSQYFDFFPANENEVFVDCGCFDGGTCSRFLGWVGAKDYEHIYSFEADPANYPNCKKRLDNFAKCDLYPYGVSDSHKKVYFASNGFEDSMIISQEEAKNRDYKGVTQIETVALDEILRDKRITFLKMDVEGAEYDALLGARELIMKNRPRMAISVYHKPEDFITIPHLILSMHPDYRIFLRHYGFDDLETILYVE